MARVIKGSPLTTPKIKIRDAYGNFMRGKKSVCAVSTYNIYAEIGDRIIIPKLTELTGDDMNAVTADVLRVLFDDYSADHDSGGVAFLHRHLMAFVRWYWNEYELPTRVPNVRVKKVAKPPKQGISQEEIDKLIKAAKEHSQFPERDIAMLMILCDTGIRRTSLANLKMQDVNLNRGELLVYEKDQQYHVKGFGTTTSKAVKKYLNCLTDVKPDDPFWLCMDGTALTWAGMRSVLRRLCDEADIDVHHFHDFRRYYGKELYNATHDIFMVSRALDHKDIEVTKRYIAVEDTENAELTRSYSPMDRRYQQTGVKVTR